MNKYTVWVTDGTIGSTAWVGCVEAVDVMSAKEVAKYECCDDWGLPSTDADDALMVIGVAEGDVKIIEWD